MKRNSYTSLWILFLFLLPFFLLNPSKSIAGMAVSPIQQWVEVEPGRQTTFTISVTNTKRSPDAKPCSVRIELLDFTVTLEGGLKFGAEYKHERSAITMIDVPQKEFVLEPGESKKVEAKVSAPWAADGDYWAAVMVSLVNPDKKDSGVTVNLRTASGIFIRVARRNYMTKGKIVDVNAALPEFGLGQTGAGDVNPIESLEKSEEQQVFKITADLENEGLVAFKVNGKAMLYAGGWRRLASIPMFTGRRRIFPTHSRRFTGVLAEPLPEGKYKLRMFFYPESKYSRTITKDLDFTVDKELAGKWSKSFIRETGKSLEIEPQELKMELTAGRFTTKQLRVVSNSLNTISVKCWLEADEKLNNWLALKSDEIVLARSIPRSIVCMARIPQDAKDGEYCGKVQLKVERSGLFSKDSDKAETYEIPVSISIGKQEKYVAK